MADQAPGQDVHPVSLPGIRAASDNIVSTLIITFVFESVNNVNVFCLLVEYAGIQQVIDFHHFFRMACDRELCVRGLYETEKRGDLSDLT